MFLIVLIILVLSFITIFLFNGQYVIEPGHSPLRFKICALTHILSKLVFL